MIERVAVEARDTTAQLNGFAWIEADVWIKPDAWISHGAHVSLRLEHAAGDEQLSDAAIELRAQCVAMCGKR